MGSSYLFLLSAPDDVVVVMFEDYEPEDSRTPTVASHEELLRGS